MLLTVPTSNEISRNSSSTKEKFTVYNIFVNGFHHCSLRYSALRDFYTEIGRLYPQLISELPEFPPKKLFSANTKTIDERRVSLERFFHALGQIRSLVVSPYFNEFLFDAQIKSFDEEFLEKNQEKQIVVRLLDSKEIFSEKIPARKNTQFLFECCATKLQLDEDLFNFFGLFLYENENQRLRIIRPLCDFESPVLTFEETKKLYPNVCFILKKCFWSPDYDAPLFENSKARHLLFIQAQHEIEQAERFDSSEIREQLNIFKENGSIRDFISRAQTSKFYGKILIEPCSIVYPFDDNAEQKQLRSCSLFVGDREFIFCFESNESKSRSKKNNGFVLKVTRIRSWKANPNEQQPNISLEYLVKKNQLKWININTKQSILISLSLQSMVQDILDRKSGAKAPKTNISATNEIENLSKNSQLNATATESTTNTSDRWADNEIFDRAADDDDL